MPVAVSHCTESQGRAEEVARVVVETSGDVDEAEAR